jgi:hypothetical protein
MINEDEKFPIVLVVHSCLSSGYVSSPLALRPEESVRVYAYTYKHHGGPRLAVLDPGGVERDCSSTQELALASATGAGSV